MTASDFNLPKRIKLRQVSDEKWAIEKLIKSRIILKDTLKIIGIAEQMRLVNNDIKVGLICTDNICSKSLVLLKENDIEVLIQH